MNDPKFAVELRRHVGVKMVMGAPVEIEHPQRIVLVGVNAAQPQQVGYYPTHEGGRFLPLSGVRERLGEWIYGQMVEAIDTAMADDTE
jgi:hypothetical protein